MSRQGCTNALLAFSFACFIGVNSDKEVPLPEIQNWNQSSPEVELITWLHTGSTALIPLTLSNEREADHRARARTRHFLLSLIYGPIPIEQSSEGGGTKCVPGNA